MPRLQPPASCPLGHALLLATVLASGLARAAPPSPTLNQVPPPIPLRFVPPPPFAFDSALLTSMGGVLRPNGGWQDLGMNVLRPPLLRAPTDLLLLSWDDAPATAAVLRVRTPRGEHAPLPWWAIDPQDDDGLAGAAR